MLASLFVLKAGYGSGRGLAHVFFAPGVGPLNRSPVSKFNDLVHPMEKFIDFGLRQRPDLVDESLFRYRQDHVQLYRRLKSESPRATSRNRLPGDSKATATRASATDVATRRPRCPGPLASS